MAVPTPVIMGSAVPEHEDRPGSAVALQESAPEVTPPSVDRVRDAILNALGEAGQPMLVSMLEIGEWAVEGSDVVVRLAVSATVIDMSVSADSKRLAMAAASGVMGRPVKLKVLPGGTAQAAAPSRPASASNGSGRGRAEQDPIVRRMQEKFGAEIRTIIDQRDKK
jgi:DNA polymerase-3 subunit gamma/tau